VARGRRSFRGCGGPVVSYSGIFFEEISQEMASPVMVVFFVAKYPGKGEIPFQDVRRGLAMFLQVYAPLVLNFISLDVLCLFPSGNNKL